MESNNKKGPQKRLSKDHFIRQEYIEKRVEAIIREMNDDYEYIVELFLEELYSVPKNHHEKSLESIINFFQNTHKMGKISIIDILLKKVILEKISLSQQLYFVKCAFVLRLELQDYVSFVWKIFENLLKNHPDKINDFQGYFSLQNGKMVVKF